MTRKVQLSLAKLREAEAEETRIRGGLQQDEIKRSRGYSDEEEAEYRRKGKPPTEAESFLSDDEEADVAEFVSMDEDEEREFSGFSEDDRMIHRCISKYFSTKKQR